MTSFHVKYDKLFFKALKMSSKCSAPFVSIYSDREQINVYVYDITIRIIINENSKKTYRKLLMNRKF